MVDRLRTRGSLRSAAVWRGVRAALDEVSAEFGRPHFDILDAGGGTGGFAVPLAELGHLVTVVDASPDSLAALERRAVEAGVQQFIRGVQGDAGRLSDVMPQGGFDVAICHSVLEVVDDPAEALVGVASCLRPGGLVSVVVANAVAVVVHRAVAGRFDEAIHALRDPLGRYGASDPVPRRFSLPDIESLIARAGFSVSAVRGSRVFADIVPAGQVDADPRAVEALIELELEAAELPALRDIATQLHILARRR